MTAEADLPPLPDPFPEPPPGQTGASRRARRGCLITGLVGCGLIVLLFFGGLLVLYTQADEMFAFILDFAETRILAELPDDVSPEERQRLERAFDSVLEHYRSRAATGADTRRLRMALTDAFGRVERGLFDRDDLRRLIDRLERIAAADPEG